MLRLALGDADGELGASDIELALLVEDAGVCRSSKFDREGLATLVADTLRLMLRDAEGVEVRVLVKSEVVDQTLHVMEGDDVPVRRASTVEFSWRA